MSNITNIPYELHLMILNKVNNKGVANITCKSWNSIIKMHLKISQPKISLKELLDNISSKTSNFYN